MNLHLMIAFNFTALRQSLEEDLIQYGKNYPELVGDVRLLRFLRGHKMNVSVAATKYREMLEFRRKYQMDLIRDAIAETNMPLEEIPNFQKIMCVALIFCQTMPHTDFAWFAALISHFCMRTTSRMLSMAMCSISKCPATPTFVRL